MLGQVYKPRFTSAKQESQGKHMREILLWPDLFLYFRDTRVAHHERKHKMEFHSNTGKESMRLTSSWGGLSFSCCDTKGVCKKRQAGVKCINSFFSLQQVGGVYHQHLFLRKKVGACEKGERGRERHKKRRHKKRKCLFSFFTCDSTQRWFFALTLILTVQQCTLLTTWEWDA